MQREKIFDYADPEHGVDVVASISAEQLEALAAIFPEFPRDRAVLLLRHSGFSYAEIADAVGLAPGSVGTTLVRAQRRFREVYEGTAGGGEGASDAPRAAAAGDEGE